MSLQLLPNLDTLTWHSSVAGIESISYFIHEPLKELIFETRMIVTEDHQSECIESALACLVNRCPGLRRLYAHDFPPKILANLGSRLEFLSFAVRRPGFFSALSSFQNLTRLDLESSFSTEILSSIIFDEEDVTVWPTLPKLRSLSVKCFTLRAAAAMLGGLETNELSRFQFSQPHNAIRGAWTAESVHLLCAALARFSKSLTWLQIFCFGGGPGNVGSAAIEPLLELHHLTEVSLRWPRGTIILDDARASRLLRSFSKARVMHLSVHGHSVRTMHLLATLCPEVKEVDFGDVDASSCEQDLLSIGEVDARHTQLKHLTAYFAHLDSKAINPLINFIADIFPNLESISIHPDIVDTALNDRGAACDL
ncbi:hypothetical protein OE88DRAFT_153153 [Heliocybe sulcata]|uniref:F-box domain-containing protein n=1 Tax=Heliocybe sulcata TaxID=5364 RepID=A0A5C3NJN1_9AGAM|nr:hypothetical protein OE88DRAFT_153153 [Heliocybe sulcata]